MPYRSNPAQHTQGPRDDGMVGEIIGQFADRLAFYRELIQNSIDAVTESVVVSIRFDLALQAAVVAVTDRGEGMSLDVLEERLMVLFRSTKEGEEGKIGKFGIGFVSVLAVDPSLVRVVSSHQGKKHVLHLYSDLRYELFEVGRATSSGTTVELEIPTKADDYEDFVTESWQALTRWCRHASVMITLEAQGLRGESLLSERIDSELGLPESLAWVQGCSPDGKARAVVGLRAKPYAAFFNHGLLLYETHEPLVENYSFVLQDSRLGHTLSRDNVRHDQIYMQALQLVAELGRSLSDEVVRCMNLAIAEGDNERYCQLAAACHGTQFLEGEDWPLPSTDPCVGGHRMVGDDAAWSAREPSALTARMAAAQIPVVDISAILGESAEFPAWFSLRCRALVPVENSLTLVLPIEPTGTDLVFVEVLQHVLEAAYRGPEKIYLAELSGANKTKLWAAGGPNEAFIGESETSSWVLSQEQVRRDVFRLLMRPALVLNVRSREMWSARKLAVREPYLAAHLIARLLLLDRGKLSDKRSVAMLEAGLSEALGVVS